MRSPIVEALSVIGEDPRIERIPRLSGSSRDSAQANSTVPS
jgi:hypothetical protein